MKSILKVYCKLHHVLIKHWSCIIGLQKLSQLTVYVWRLHSMSVSGRFSTTAVCHKLTGRFDPKSTSCCGTMLRLSSTQEQQDLLVTTCSGRNIRSTIIEILTSILIRFNHHRHVIIIMITSLVVLYWYGYLICS